MGQETPNARERTTVKLSDDPRQNTTEVSVHDVLRQRGNLGIAVMELMLTQLKPLVADIEETLASIRAIDEQLHILPVDKPPIKDMLELLRSSNPQFADLTDEQLVKALKANGGAKK